MIGIAAGDAGQRRRPVARADVDPLVGDVGRLAALSLGDQVHRAPADDAVDCTPATLDDDGAPGQQQRIDAAQLVEVDEAVLVDPGDLQADLIGVGGDHDLRRAAGVDRGHDVAEHVGLGSGDRGEAPPDELLDRLLETARTGSRDQLAQKADVGRHAYLLVGPGILPNPWVRCVRAR